MNKILSAIFIIIVIAVGSLVWYVENHHADVYYIQVQQNGEIEKNIASSNNLLGFYRYKVHGFDEEGGRKKLDFTVNHNLRLKAYLKISNNKKRGVISWEEVKRKAIPKKALHNLDEESIRIIPQNK